MLVSPSVSTGDGYTSLLMARCLVHIHRQFENDHCSIRIIMSAGLFDINPATMRVDGSLEDCKSQACSLCLGGVERFENSGPLLLIEAWPLVRNPHLDSRPIFAWQSTAFHHNLTVARRYRYVLVLLVNQPGLNSLSMQRIAACSSELIRAPFGTRSPRFVRVNRPHNDTRNPLGPRCCMA